MNRIVTAGLAACLAAIGAASLSAAQSPEPSGSPGPTLRSSLGPDFQRVELAEAGFAVSFPVAWTVDVRTVPFSAASILPRPDTEAAILVNAYASDAFHGCRISLWQSVDTTPEGFARWYAGLSQPELGVEPAPLSVGEAFRVTLNESDSTDPDAEMFVLSLDEDILALTCLAEGPPDDRWLSIAETFEFLPAEE